MTEKGKQRLLSSKSIKIPKQTLYVIDKVVRKKLAKDKKKRASSAKSPGSDGLTFTMSPEPLRDRTESTERQREGHYKTPNKSAPDIDYISIPYDEWYQMKEVYKHYKDKLLKSIKQEMKQNLIAKVSMEIEDYERKLDKIMKSEKAKKKQSRIKKKLKKQQEIIKEQDKEHQAMRKNAAFKDWLKNSINKLVVEKKEERRRKHIEHLEKKRKEEFDSK